MEKQEYEIVFHLLEGKEVKVSYEGNKKDKPYEVYREVIEGSSEYMRVKDDKGTFHNIAKDKIIDISVYPITYIDPNEISF